MSAPSSFLLDSDCLIAAMSLSHPFHAEARAEVGKRVAAGGAIVLAIDTLVQAYSVLTRMPRPHRLSPRSAWTLVQTFRGSAPLVGLSAAETERALSRAAFAGIAGGAIYDYLIAEAAVQAGVSTLLTFNLRDYARFGFPLEVVRPSLGA